MFVSSFIMFWDHVIYFACSSTLSSNLGIFNLRQSMKTVLQLVGIILFLKQNITTHENTHNWIAMKPWTLYHINDKSTLQCV